MHRLTLAMCSLILGTWLVPAFVQPAEEAQKKLQGTWTATKAERDGKAADDVVGHRLSFTGNRFQIQSKDGKPPLIQIVRAHSFGERREIEIRRDKDARVFIPILENSSAHYNRSSAFTKMIITDAAKFFSMGRSSRSNVVLRNIPRR
jgi:hypothetical protein